MEKLLEKCPNCRKPDPEISKMPDGSCGVCGGTGVIEWHDTGIKLRPTTITIKE